MKLLSKIPNLRISNNVGPWKSYSNCLLEIRHNYSWQQFHQFFISDSSWIVLCKRKTCSQFLARRFHFTYSPTVEAYKSLSFLLSHLRLVKTGHNYRLSRMELLSKLKISQSATNSAYASRIVLLSSKFITITADSNFTNFFSLLAYRGQWGYVDSTWFLKQYIKTYKFHSHFSHHQLVLSTLSHCSPIILSTPLYFSLFFVCSCTMNKHSH